MNRHRHFLIAMLLTFAVMLVAVHPVLPVQTRTDRKALLPTADAMVWSNLPDINTDRGDELWVLRATEVILSFLMFDLAEIPAGSTIEEATLRLYTNRDTGNGTVNVHYCPSNDWTEDDITYNNKPAFQPESMSTVNITYHVAKWYEWNITNTAASTFSSADKRLSLALNGTAYLHVIVFNSRQSPAIDRRPQLSILYSYTASSGMEPVLVGLAVVGVVAASAIGLLAYIRRKKRKQP